MFAVGRACTSGHGPVPQGWWAALASWFRVLCWHTFWCAHGLGGTKRGPQPSLRLEGPLSLPFNSVILCLQVAKEAAANGQESENGGGGGGGSSSSGGGGKARGMGWLAHYMAPLQQVRVWLDGLKAGASMHGGAQAAAASGLKLKRGVHSRHAARQACSMAGMQHLLGWR